MQDPTCNSQHREMTTPILNCKSLLADKYEPINGWGCQSSWVCHFSIFFFNLYYGSYLHHLFIYLSYSSTFFLSMCSSSLFNVRFSFISIQNMKNLVWAYSVYVQTISLSSSFFCLYLTQFTILFIKFISVTLSIKICSFYHDYWLPMLNFFHVFWDFSSSLHFDFVPLFLSNLQFTLDPPKLETLLHYPVLDMQPSTR